MQEQHAQRSIVKIIVRNFDKRTSKKSKQKPFSSRCHFVSKRMHAKENQQFREDSHANSEYSPAQVKRSGLFGPAAKDTTFRVRDDGAVFESRRSNCPKSHVSPVGFLEFSHHGPIRIETRIHSQVAENGSGRCGKHGTRSTRGVTELARTARAAWNDRRGSNASH